MARKTIDKEDLEEKKLKFEQVADNLEVISAEKFLKDNYLPYAWSFNLDRALTDVSGLKPVQRRILYTMYKDNLNPTANRSKVASLAGRVLAYHPHGDASVADALKNLARDHIFRVPLIDGKGDFGAPGTPGAAGRYIEARLNKAAWINVEEIGENAVSMTPNYDNTTVEPVRIPIRWPVAVINGGSGMGIGYAANMPSHNPTEIMTACSMLLKNPDATHEDIAAIVHGPDFNMGGLITAKDGITDYLATGSGSFKIRGQYTVEPKGRGIHRIEFYEIPFGTYPEKIIDEINKKSDAGGFQDVSVYKDLSDLKHPIRVIIETKQGVNPKKVLGELFKNTSLESSFAANITAIVDHRPVRLSMKDALLDFIEFRKECVRNKSKFNLKKAKDRQHLIDGLFKVLLDIDKAISIIRGSDDATDARTKLMKTFTIDEKQADYVLGLQLRRLTKMDKVALQEEHDKLSTHVDYLEKLLSSDEFMIDYLDKEFAETLSIIGDERKTEVSGLSIAELAEREKEAAKELKNIDKDLPCYVTRFASGILLKSEEPFAYEHGLKKIPHGPIVEQLVLSTKSDMVLVDSQGYGHTVPVSFLPMNHAMEAHTVKEVFKSRGLVAIAKAKFGKNDHGLALGTRNGDVKIVRPDYNAKEEFVMYSLPEGDEIVFGRWMTEPIKGSFFVSITSGSNILVYDAESVRPTGSAAGGVKGQKLREGENVISFNWVPASMVAESMILSKTEKTVKMTSLADIPPKGRASQGVALHGFRKGETSVVQSFVGKDLIITVTGRGNVIPVPPVTRRAGSGVDFNFPSEFGSMS